MKLGQTPVFRKAIIPWYDSDAVCIGLILFAVAVILFAVAGISVAKDTPAYAGYIWVPVLLAVLAAAVLVSTGSRLVRRAIDRSTR